MAKKKTNLSFIEGATWLQKPCVARRCLVEGDFSKGYDGKFVCLEIYQDKQIFYIHDDEGQGTFKVLNGGTQIHAHREIQAAKVIRYLDALNIQPGTEIPNRRVRRALKKKGKKS